MRYIIYVDVFFVVNMIMDSILLKVTAHFIKPQTTLMRCLLGGAAGGLLSVASLMLSYENMLVHMLITYIFTVVVMVYITYGKANLRQFMLRAMWLYLVTIIFGGAMNLIYSYTYFGYMLQGIIKSVCNTPFTVGKMLVFTGIAYISLRGVSILWEGRRKCREYVKAIVFFNGKMVEVPALIDTGNTLNCAYSKKPIHIIEYDALELLLEGVNIYDEKYRLVPFNSLGRRHGLIEVIECDEIKVCIEKQDSDMALNDNEEEREHNIIYYEEKPAIGIYRGKLSSSKPYRALLHSIVGD